MLDSNAPESDPVRADFHPIIEDQQARGIEMRENVRAILPTIAANAMACDEARQVPEENVKLLIEAGFTRALQPLAHGGLELSPDEYCPAIVDIAGACPSTAWALGLLAQHNHGLALFSKEAQEEVWGPSKDTLVSSSVAPLGKVEAVDGGVKLTSRAGWSSGCDHADWAVVGFMRPDPVMGGEMGPHLALIPREDYEIIDDWHTAGLRGTGSKTLKIDNVFVPEHRIESMIGLNVGSSKGYGIHDGGIFKSAFSPYFSFGFSAVAVGVAKKFLDVYRKKVSGRVRAYTGAKVGQAAPAYMRLAESMHQVRAAQASLAQDWREIASRSRSGQLPLPDEMEMWRTNQAYATKMSIEAVNRLFVASGGGAWFSSNEMQKYWRDVNMTGAHAYSDYDVASQKLGRHALGLDLDSNLF